MQASMQPSASMQAQEQPRRHPPKIAIIGGGISSIACSWNLRRHDCDVDIYEADDKLGGHANSVPFIGNGRSVNVDTGFIAMDELTYPQFSAFLRELDVKTIPTDMSFGVSTDGGALEWGSYSIRSFLQGFHLLFSLWFWRLLFEVVRFTLFAEDILHEDKTVRCDKEDSEHLLQDVPTQGSHLESIGEHLKKEGYSYQFMTYFLIPMMAAPWCIDPDEFARTFPAKTLIQFMSYHRLLDTVSSTLRWRSFRNGSKTYIDAYQKTIPARHQLHLGTRIESVIQLDNGASIQFSDGTRRSFDHVVLAIHANQALSLLGSGATETQRTILSAFKTTRNVCYLHSDTSLLPKRPSARVAWNCSLAQTLVTKHTQLNPKFFKPNTKPTSKSTGSAISITFDMNKLQGIPFPGEPESPGRVLVTMNPIRLPRNPQSSQVYYHPLLTSESILMSPHLDRINGVGNISLAGAWMGFGFHEDGFAAGAHVARRLIKGRDNTAPLDLVARVRGNRRRKLGGLRLVLRLGVSVLHKLLFEDKMAL